MIKQLKLLNILLVEDEQIIQKSLKESFEYFFKKVFVASNGLEALEIYNNNKIHAIFTDYEMPLINGYELVKEIRSFNSKIPITIISNHNDSEKLHKCIPLGLSGYVFKPLKYELLKKYLEEFSLELNEKKLFIYPISETHQINLIEQIIIENNKKHHLTKLEINFLEILLQLDGRIATFEYLYTELEIFDVSQASLKNLVYRIKTKYNFTYIKNLKNVGYALVKDV